MRDKTLFRLKSGYEIAAWSERTRYGFRHIAELFDTKFNKVGRSTASYYNRTWESFTFEMVIRKVLDGCKAFDASAVTFIMDSLRNEARGEINRQFGMVAGVAKLAEIFCEKQSDKNDWKARMLKAGMPGLSMPGDWSSLSEDEKTQRLDKVIAECGS